jgi:uncharacterized membrane protein
MWSDGREKVVAMTEADEQEYGVSRLIAFSDGVFGFATTLLITTIPTTLSGLSSSSSNKDVFSQLLGLLPNFSAYAFSFYMIGAYWMVHHRLFRQIIKYNSTLLWINLTLLLFVAFLPVPTAFLGRYGFNAVITAFYGANLTIVSLIYLILAQYAEGNHRLVDPGLNQEAIRSDRLGGLITIAFFVASIGIAFLNPLLAKFCWLATVFVRPPVRRAPRPNQVPS